MSKLDNVRRRLRGEEKGLLTKYSERVGVLERARPLFAAVGLLGALVAAVARLFEGNLGIGLTVGGALLAAMGAALVVLMDFRKLELNREAQSAHDLAEEAILAGEELEARLAEAEQRTEAVTANATILDRQRRARLRAMRLMVETVEAAVLGGQSVSATAEKMLDVTKHLVRQAVGVEVTDDFSISIFRREAREGHEDEMYRVGCYCTMAQEREYDQVSWEKGRGYVGSLWNEASANSKAELILFDTTLPELAGKFPVDEPDPERDSRYISVAAYPILIRRSQNVWGIAIAAIDRKGLFARVGDKPTQGVEMVEDIAYVAALLAGLGTAANG